MDVNFPKLEYLIRSMLLIWKDINATKDLERDSGKTDCLLVYGVKDGSSLYKLVRITGHNKKGNNKTKICHYFVGVNTHKGVGTNNPIIHFEVSGDEIEKDFAEQINKDIRELDESETKKQLVPTI